MSFSTPEDFFIPGDKEPIKNQLNLDWLTVGMLLLGVQEPHRREAHRCGEEADNSFMISYLDSPGVVVGEMLRFFAHF